MTEKKAAPKPVAKKVEPKPAPKVALPVEVAEPLSDAHYDAQIEATSANEEVLRLHGVIDGLREFLQRCVKTATFDYTEATKLLKK